MDKKKVEVKTKQLFPTWVIMLVLALVVGWLEGGNIGGLER